MATPATTPTTPTNNASGIDQIANMISAALHEFQAFQSSETYKELSQAITPVAQYGRKAIDNTASYVRKHPVQLAVGLVVLGLFTTLVKTRAPQKTLH